MEQVLNSFERLISERDNTYFNNAAIIMRSRLKIKKSGYLGARKEVGSIVNFPEEIIENLYKSIP